MPAAIGAVASLAQALPAASSAPLQEISPRALSIFHRHRHGRDARGVAAVASAGTSSARASSTTPTRIGPASRCCGRQGSAGAAVSLPTCPTFTASTTCCTTTTAKRTHAVKAWIDESKPTGTDYRQQFVRSLRSERRAAGQAVQVAATNIRPSCATGPPPTRGAGHPRSRMAAQGNHPRDAGRRLAVPKKRSPKSKRPWPAKPAAGWPK